MHQEWMNQDVARVQRAEILRNAGRRQVVEETTERTSALHAVRVRLSAAVHRLAIHRHAPHAGTS